MIPGQTDTKTMTQSSDKSILFQRKRGDVVKLIFAISHLNFITHQKKMSSAKMLNRNA